ncbi:uncharacterized protein LOC144430640 [Styela clava]
MINGFVCYLRSNIQIQNYEKWSSKKLTKLRKICNTGWNRETCNISEKTVKTSGNLSHADDIIRTLLGSFDNFSLHRMMKIRDTKKQARPMKNQQLSENTAGKPGQFIIALKNTTIRPCHLSDIASLSVVEIYPKNQVSSLMEMKS